MRHLLPAIGQVRRPDARHPDRRQPLRRLRRHLAQHPGRHPRRRRHDHRVRRLALAVPQRHHVAVPLRRPLDALHRAPQPQLARQPRHHRLHQRMRPTVERYERRHRLAAIRLGRSRRPPALASGRAQPANHAPIAPLHRPVLWERRLDALLLRHPVVHPRQQRLGQLVQRLRPEAPPHEARQRLVRLAPPRRQHEIQPHPQLAPRREEWRAHEWPQPRRRHQLHALRDALRPAPVQHERARVGQVHAHHALAQPHLTRQRHSPRLARQKGVRTLFQQEWWLAEALHALRLHLPAPAARFLQQRIAQRQPAFLRRPLQVPRRGQPRDAPAGDHHPLHHPHRTRSPADRLRPLCTHGRNQPIASRCPPVCPGGCHVPD